MNGGVPANITLNTGLTPVPDVDDQYLYALQRGEDVDTSLKELEACRLAYRDSYAESQMVVPDTVLRSSARRRSV
ncbi:hypothetical protein GCM10023238_14160 [Streptomyces heliomycini]